MAKEIDISKSRDQIFHDTHVSEMMKKLHANEQSESSETPIPSAGAAINPNSDLAKNLKRSRRKYF